MDDMELLREYALRGSEEAFATLVSRHINMVYSVALRHVGNPHNAQEITQAVFIILARKSRSLRRETIISGWLFQTARLTAANFLRSETRRTRREQGAYMRSNLHEGGDNAWKQIAPFLNDGIASLDEKDRNAILLRYIEGMSLKDVGAALGASEDAAKKRVSRAVEKLRIFFGNRGVTLSGSVLTGCLAANSVEAAPAGLAVAVTAAVLKGTALAASTSTLVKGTLKVMAWTKVKIAVGAGVAALVAVQSYEIVSRNKQLASLREQAPAQNAKPEAEPAQIANRELEQLRVDRMNLSNEVFKLRGQLASTKPRPPQPPQPEVKLSRDAPGENAGRQFGLAIAQGDPTALDKLLAMAKAEKQYFNTNSVGMNETERGELARQTFAPLRAAFDAITEEASKGNQAALQAVSRAIQIPELRAFATSSAGILAGNGDEVALQILLNPKDYDIPLSNTIGALKPAADNGNQKAIDALAAVAADQSQRALWYIVASALGNAAASGNPAAIDALIAMSGDTNQGVRSVVIAGLKQASANQNAKATDTLRQMNNQ
jgi:RNA polymerase sigma factor (sigma-70 family)